MQYSVTTSSAKRKEVERCKYKSVTWQADMNAEGASRLSEQMCPAHASDSLSEPQSGGTMRPAHASATPGAAAVTDEDEFARELKAAKSASEENKWLKAEKDAERARKRQEGKD